MDGHPLEQYQDSDLHFTQFSIPYSNALAGQENRQVRGMLDLARAPYPHAFVTDVINRVIPVPGHTEKQFEIRIEPSNPTTEAAVAFALSPPDGFHRSIEDAVWYFVRSCVGTLMLFEQVAYEIAYYWLRQSSKVVAFDLVPIPPKSLLVRDGRMIQRLPRSLTPEGRVTYDIELDHSRLITFSVPEYLHGKLKGFMERIATLSAPFPRFLPQDIGHSSASSQFDLVEYNRARDLALAKAGRLLGWQPYGRLFGGSDERITEFYFVHRRLRFERFIIELRDGVVTNLNECLARGGRLLRLPMRLEINGLPTLRDVEEAEARLLPGEGSVRDVIAPFSGW